jgi:hypothetical protein
MTSYGPDIIYKKSECPFAWLHQNHGGRAHAEFSLSEDARLCGGWQEQLRADSPDHFAAFLRGEKNAGCISPKP